MPHEEPTVFVVDDDESVRTSLSFLLGGAGFQIETFADPRTFLTNYSSERRGCLVLDLHMPNMDGIQVLQQLARNADTRPVIVLTGHGDVPSAVQAMKAGAIDFLQKPFRAEELLERVRLAVGLDREWRQWQAEAGEIAARLRSLSPREHEVLDLVVNGCSTREIAATLGLSPKTVEIHRHNVLRKMQARSAVDLVRLAGAVSGYGRGGESRQPHSVA